MTTVITHQSLVLKTSDRLTKIYVEFTVYLLILNELLIHTDLPRNRLENGKGMFVALW